MSDEVRAHVKAEKEHPVRSSASLVTLEKLFAYLLGPNVACKGFVCVVFLSLCPILVSDLCADS